MMHLNVMAPDGEKDRREGNMQNQVKEDGSKCFMFMNISREEFLFMDMRLFRVLNPSKTSELLDEPVELWCVVYPRKNGVQRN